MDHREVNKKYTLFIVIASVVYICYHLLTLSYSPLPWFDEVAFASITESYMKHGTFVEEARHVNWHGEKLMYGPIYFVWQAALARMFGLGIFTFRITALVFGFVNLYLIYKICRRFQFTALATFLTIAIVALDPSYNQFLHSGRMDMITLFFFLVSYLVFAQDDYYDRRYVWHGLATGVLLACAMLTNPRVVFTFAFFACYFVYELIDRRAIVGKVIVKYGLVLVALVGIYGIWIYGKFGSLHDFIATNYTNSAVMKEHVGFTLSEFKLNQSILLIAYALFCTVLLIKRRKEGKNTELLLLTVPVIIGFMVVVSGGIVGRYFASVAPFTTLLIVGGTMNMAGPKIYKGITWAIAGVFALVFIGKGFAVVATMNERDEEYYKQAITAIVPQHVSVAGDFPYYYMLTNNNDSFQCIEENGTYAVKIVYFRKVTFDYLVISESSITRKDYEDRMMFGRYELIAHITNNKPMGLLQRAARILPYHIQDTYSCYIYKLKAGVPRIPG